MFVKFSDIFFGSFNGGCNSQAEPVSFSTADLGLLPCDVSLNAVSFEEIAPFLSLGFPNVEAEIGLNIFPSMFFFFGNSEVWCLGGDSSA